MEWYIFILIYCTGALAPIMAPLYNAALNCVVQSSS